jgi:histidinol phosphatase-like PHP family hydrolase
MNNPQPVYDFHLHTFLSDGVLLPIELLRRAVVAGYLAIAIADHAGPSTLDDVIPRLARDCALAEKHWPIRALPAAELTHCPPAAIAELAAAARRAGARIIVVHGETIVEPVEPGTNRAAVSCPDVDLLAHPGLITLDDARLAARNGVFLEISARKGHCLANGHVVAIGRQAGCSFLVNSDGHEPADLLSAGFAEQVAAGAGLSGDEIATCLRANAESLLQRVSNR